MLPIEANPRRFTLRRGNAKTLRARLFAQRRAPQQLPAGSIVTLTAWRAHDLPAYAITAKACTVLDDGTETNRGRVACDFSAGESLALVAGVYELRFDVLVGGSVPLTFPDDDGRLDPDRRVLLLVTEQA